MLNEGLPGKSAIIPNGPHIVGGDNCYCMKFTGMGSGARDNTPLCPISVIGQRVIIIDPIAHSPDIIGCKGCNAIERWIAVLSWGNTPTGTIPMLDELSISTPANRPDVISCESSGPEQLI